MRPVDAYRVFIEHLGVQNERSILDVGCGTGSLLRIAGNKGLKTHGIDISIEALKVAKKIVPSSHLMLGVGEGLPFSDGSFDYITCLGAIEHFQDIDRGLKEMIRVAKKDAKFCILVPNIDYKFKAGTEQPQEVLLNYDEWKDFLERNGLYIIKVKQDRYFAKHLTIGKILKQKGLKGKLRMLKKKLLWTFMPLRKTYQFIFICKAA